MNGFQIEAESKHTQSPPTSRCKCWGHSSSTVLTLQFPAGRAQKVCFPSHLEALLPDTAPCRRQAMAWLLCTLPRLHFPVALSNSVKPESEASKLRLMLCKMKSKPILYFCGLEDGTQGHTYAVHSH